MKYHNITHDDMLNGQGLRVVLWVSGCSHKCNECQNPITWNPEKGLDFDESAEKELLADLKKDYIEGVTFSGGDPLYIQNRDEVTRLAKKIKEEFPSKNIWLYTGYIWEEICELEIIKYVDVIVDGPFKKEMKDVKLHWKGSSNQRVIDVQQSINCGKVTILED